MGHTRIGQIPKSKAWSDIVALLNEEQSSIGLTPEQISAIADASLLAAEEGFKKTIQDDGVCHSLYIITKILESIATNDSKSRYYINIEDIKSSREFAFLINRQIRTYLIENNISSDKSELAQRALINSILSSTRPDQHSLLGDSDNQEKINIKELASKKGFANLSHNFFALYANYYTNFFISKITSYSTGINSIKNIEELSNFNSQSQKHWNESASIVREFSGTWFAKKVFYEKDLQIGTVKSFLKTALDKIVAETKTQRGDK